jgi:hypothetical protein
MTRGMELARVTGFDMAKAREKAEQYLESDNDYFAGRGYPLWGLLRIFNELGNEKETAWVIKW